MAERFDLDEEARLDALARLELLDTEPEEAFDRITRLVKNIFDIPISLVSLVDRNRQWFKSRAGLETCETPRDISFCSHAIATDQPFIIEDAANDARFADNPLVTGPPHLRFYAGIPLRTRNGHRIGTLCAIDTVPRHLDAGQIEILGTLAQLVIDEMELRLIAMTDSLTGAMSRRAFRAAAQRDLARARRHLQHFTLVMLDLDHFKAINDTHGHSIGDLVLQRSVGICRNVLRVSDYIGRIGGEEFGIALTDTPPALVPVVLERLRSSLADARVFSPRSALRFTASMGHASLTRDTRDLDDLMRRADVALYAAKASGRDRFVAYEELPTQEATRTA
jgi:diguanylate cyclase (GGDEF)-like protein